jgi:hypothetical protein
MSEVTYYVALPFVFSDDGIAAGEAAECLSANAAVMRAEALSRKRPCRRHRLLADRRPIKRGLQRREANSQVRRRARRSQRPMNLY